MEKNYSPTKFGGKKGIVRKLSRSLVMRLRKSLVIFDEDEDRKRPRWWSGGYRYVGAYAG